MGDSAVEPYSEEVLSCYAAIVATAASGGFPQGKRWEILVPSASGCVKKVVVDRGFNRLNSRESANLVVLPDWSCWPLATEL
eukprot:487867-Prymnesium_polylepis.1